LVIKLTIHYGELVPGNFGSILNFLLASNGPAEPLDATVRTLMFRETPVDKHW